MQTPPMQSREGSDLRIATMVGCCLVFDREHLPLPNVQRSILLIRPGKYGCACRLSFHHILDSMSMSPAPLIPPPPGEGKTFMLKFGVCASYSASGGEAVL
jgi:hypothetical protein